jgi:hypothetical protein
MTNKEGPRLLKYRHQNPSVIEIAWLCQLNLQETRLSLTRVAHFRLDFRILAARNEPAPFALD